MPKRITTDSVALYAEARGISVDAARKRRDRRSADFLDWQNENANKPKKRARKSSPKPKAETETHSESADMSLARYRELEEKTFQQLQIMQGKLDDALTESAPVEIRVCSQALKDVASLYNDVVALRKQAEVAAAQLLPIEVLDKYKSTFYPRIEKGVEEMRMHIEAFLPDHMRADFKSAWRSAYPKYQTAAREAESAIEGVREESRNTKIKK